ncbi:MAG TPA: NADH-quinone oxidoreductase subunit N, partial [Sphingomonas sp.]|nr:NADH-quinone oxidoreductase subunit N [Sphingomonas sp.]
YLRVVKTMYFDEPAAAFGRVDAPVESGLIVLTAAFVSPLGYFLIPLLTAWTMTAAASLF